MISEKLGKPSNLKDHINVIKIQFKHHIFFMRNFSKILAKTVLS
jgi:hypothetical protein